MMGPLNIADDNLSHAWARAFLALMRPGVSVRHPSVITINIPNGQILEDRYVRAALDTDLLSGGQNGINTVANTIFPQSYWNPSAPNDAEILFERYERAWKGIKKCPANKYGVYFRRMTSYTPKSGNINVKPVNQLEHIASTYNGGNHRKSALHASILDPTRDHSNSRQKGFPCLQQVAFTPLGINKLGVTGFYATQYQYEKAYGNYLGLARLGAFMAKQIGMELIQVVCMASVIERGDLKKYQLEPLATKIREILTSAGKRVDD